MNVLERHSYGQVAECLLERQTQILLLIGNAKFTGDWVRHLLCDQLQPGRKGIAGPNSSRQHIHGVREKFFKSREASTPANRQDDERRSEEHTSELQSRENLVC